jgi:hypothetical protein
MGTALNYTMIMQTNNTKSWQYSWFHYDQKDALRKDHVVSVAFTTLEAWEVPPVVLLQVLVTRLSSEGSLSMKITTDRDYGRICVFYLTPHENITDLSDGDIKDLLDRKCAEAKAELATTPSEMKDPWW